MVDLEVASPLISSNPHWGSRGILQRKFSKIDVLRSGISSILRDQASMLQSLIFFNLGVSTKPPRSVPARSALNMLMTITALTLSNCTLSPSQGTRPLFQLAGLLKLVLGSHCLVTAEHCLPGKIKKKRKKGGEKGDIETRPGQETISI